MNFRAIAAASSLVCLLACGDSGPRAIDVSNPCVDCELRLDTVAQLGSHEAPTSIQATAATVPCAVARLSDSVYAVGWGTGWVPPMIFERGAYTRSVGASGPGPEELGGDLRILQGDPTSERWLAVVDNGNRHVIAYDSGGNVINTAALPARIFSQVGLDRGRIALHARGTLGGVSTPLFHVLDLVNDSLTSFEPSDPMLAQFDQWVLGPADGGFLAAAQWRYEVRKYDDQGGEIWRLSRAPRWFTENLMDRERHGLGNIYVSAAPPSHIAAVAETDDRKLLVFSLVADRQWRPNTLGPVSPEWLSQNYDTVVEVIDLDDRRLLASLRLDEWVAPVCGSQDVFSVVRTETGDLATLIRRPVW